MGATERQRGFALLELVVAALLAGLLALWASHTLVGRINDSRAHASAVWMLSARQATLTYLERYSVQLAQADHAMALADAGYADWSAPTLAEFKADALLSPGFPEQAFLDGLSVRLLRHGSCPATPCRIEAVVHSNSPYVHRRLNRLDEQMMAQWILASNGWGGAVTEREPHLIRGPAFQFANPSWLGPPLPPGTVVLAVTSEQLRDRDFLRVRDDRDPDFQSEATVRGDVHAGANLNVGRYMHFQSAETMLAACAEDGAVARGHAGGLLICRESTWRPASRSGAGGFSTNQHRGCRNSLGTSTANPITGSCSCPQGTAVVQISDSGPHDLPEGRTVGFLCID